MNNEPLDWGVLVTMTMLKTKRHPTFKIPYALLVSRILEYKGVNVEGEQVVRTNNLNRMLDSTLIQLQMVHVNDIYVHKDDVLNEGDEIEDSDEDMPPAAELPSDQIQSVGTSSTHHCRPQILPGLQIKSRRPPIGRWTKPNKPLGETITPHTRIGRIFGTKISFLAFLGRDRRLASGKWRDGGLDPVRRERRSRHCQARKPINRGSPPLISTDHTTFSPPSL
ncbi:unnamed protein product [Sphenostylis stenocarpa]|uniref:Uncharacterized protein n=1 Tax=Sphenostylis stenocarpa TaxID=92480 RepID=A0AA86SQ38_9FABA|nr:unnamed protein product [Sphenostylis stenocarpa]